MSERAAIIRLEAEHLPQLRALLRDNGLPDEDCAEQLQHFVGIFEAAKLLAAGGLQPAGADALLRSVVVESRSRSQGLGRQITDYLLAQAPARGYRSVYLLTETAADYFEKTGFRRIERAGVPESIAATRQFTALCPDGAVCMRHPVD